MPKKKPRNEQKEEKEKQKRKEQDLATIKMYLNLIRNHPAVWLNPEFQFIRQFVYDVSTQPSTFPPCLPCTPLIGEGKQPALSEGFVSSVLTSTNQKAVCRQVDLPVVKVTLISSKSEYMCGRKILKYSAYILDGSGDSLVVKFDNILNGRMSLVQSGTIVRLFAYKPVYCHYENNEAQLFAALLLSNFDVLCRTVMSKEEEPHPESVLTVAKELASAPRTPFVENPHNDLSNNSNLPLGITPSGNGSLSHEVSPSGLGNTPFDNAPPPDDAPLPRNEGEPSDDDEPPESPPPDPPEDPELNPAACHGQLCSLYGLNFLQCITECFPVVGRNLEGIARECYFVTMEVNQMTNRKKRNLLYYWYATNVYNIVGKYNRERLPPCLESAVRSAYPEPNGHYTGFREAPNQDDLDDMEWYD